MKILFIIDIDNTVAENAQRTHLLPNWEAFFKSCDTDTSITPILNAIEPYLKHSDIEVMFITGREEYDEVKHKTQMWLEQRNISGYPIHYRAHNEYSKSFIFKERVLSRVHKPEHKYVVILDDDEGIIKHFTTLGHTAIQVKRDNDYLDTCKELKTALNSLIDKLNLGKNLNSKPNLQGNLEVST